MKEFTIEEKAQRYDKAIKVAENIHRFSSDLAEIKRIEQIFPELKKPEDEEIRKMLIVFFGKGAENNSSTNGISDKDILAWLEKQGEQKLVDKTEPKFKASDWVIDKQGLVHQIANVIENVTCHTYSYDIVGGGYFNDNTEGVRLWTIQDAKDGDVLYDGNVACIFRKTMEDDDDIWIDTYCGINIDNEFKVNDVDECWCLSENCSPATKEQREQLEKAMADAGYTFDFEKKKLKKIQQKPDCSEEDETGWTNTMIMIKEVASNHYTKDSIKLVIDWLKSLKDRIGG